MISGLVQYNLCNVGLSCYLWYVFDICWCEYFEVNMLCICTVAMQRTWKMIWASTLPLFLPTEPCPPNNVVTSVQCQKGIGAVSWEPSFGAVGYKASLAGRDGHSLSCSTNETFCNMEGLHCGVVYYTNVIAIGETLNSTASTTVTLVSGLKL